MSYDKRGRSINTKKLIADILRMKVALLLLAVYFISTYYFFDTVCPLVAFTGFPCPACGLTRAGEYLLHGEVRKAIAMNVSIICWGLLMIVGFIKRYVFEDWNLSLRKLVIFTCIVTYVVYLYKMRAGFPNRAPLVYHKNNFLYLYSKKYRELMDVLLF